MWPSVAPWLVGQERKVSDQSTLGIGARARAPGSRVTNLTVSRSEEGCMDKVVEDMRSKVKRFFAERLGNKKQEENEKESAHRPSWP